jgi:hypothetical protein
MKVADVIRESSSSHVIYFLLNSYVGVARDCEKLNCLPDKIGALPLTGKEDVRLRFEILMLELDAASKRRDDKKCVDVKEALAVFGTALYRLRSIDAKRSRSLDLETRGRMTPPAPEANA